MVNFVTLRHATRATLLATLCFGAACVVDEPLAGETGKKNGKVEDTSGPLMPLAEGYTWTYKITGDGEESKKVVTVAAEEAVGGDGPHAEQLAFRIVTKEGDDESVAWQALDGKKVVRFREQGFSKKTGEPNSEESWDPPRIIVDGSSAHIKRGVKWVEETEYTEQKDEDDPKSEPEEATWQVDGVDQEVTVPAGTFRALVVKRITDETKTYWFVKGIGKVKETGKKTEELTKYKVESEDEEDDEDEESESAKKPDAGTKKPDAGTKKPDASTSKGDASTKKPDASTGKEGASTAPRDAGAELPDPSPEHADPEHVGSDHDASVPAEPAPETLGVAP
jgi:hypothetical protein